jgi:hypothetical protein
MKKSFTYLFFLFTSTMVFGQKGTLNLIVQDETNEPLIGATIKVFQNEQLVHDGWSDFNGMTQFQLDPGLYDMVTTYIGCATEYTRDIEIRANELHAFQVNLKWTIVFDCGMSFTTPNVIDPNPENTGTTFQANQIWYSSRMNY